MGWFDERFQNRKERVRCQCVICHREMWFPPSKVGKYLTCSQSCAQALREKRTQELNELRKRRCVRCGCEFVPKKSQLDSGVGIYCSHACAYDVIAASTINSPEAQKRARSSWRETFRKNPGFVKRGADNPMWNGGMEARRERIRIAVKEYKKSNPEKVRIWNANRRAKTGRAPTNVIRQLMKSQRGKCAVCLKTVNNDYHIDHILPLSLGGTGDASNLQILCPPCNLRKAAKHPVEFRQEIWQLC